MDNTVKIACRGALSIRIDDLNEFQGELKSLSVKNYEKLKREIIDNGFSFTVHVWFHKGRYFILDGHQRVRTLKKMIEEGWTCLELPCSTVEAESYQQAKRKLLGAASSYGRVENDGLLEYLQETDISPDELISRYDFGTMNLINFVESNFESLSSSQIDTLNDSEKALDLDSKPKKTHTCPRCSFEFS